jgi:hypothetical protein
MGTASFEDTVGESRPGRKSKPGRSGGLLESVFDNLVERASRERNEDLSPSDLTK